MADDLAEDWWEETVPTVDTPPIDTDAGEEDTAHGTTHSKKRKAPAGHVFDGATGQWVPAQSPADAAKMEAKKQRRKQEREKLRAAFAHKQEALLQMVKEGKCCKLLNDLLSNHAGNKADDTTSDLLDPTFFAEVDTEIISEGLDAALVSAYPGGISAIRKPPQTPGSPNVVVVVQSAIRAVDVLRTLGARGVGKLGKLFGKHKQKKDQEAFLKSQQLCCAVGTPARLVKLAETNALMLAECKLLVIEASHIDAKKRTFLELHDERRDLATLLRDSVAPACQQGKLKIVLC
eukprot:m.56953 g.56953  ORF g.56953 m.56953 type:complete len:291 (+) comp7715_c0_seq1:138-1010(+)